MVTFFSHAGIVVRCIRVVRVFMALECYNRGNFHRLTFRERKFSFLVDREHHYSSWHIFGLPNAQECDHVSFSFWLDKQSHVARVVNVWRQNQLSRVPWPASKLSGALWRRGGKRKESLLASYACKEIIA